MTAPNHIVGGFTFTGVFGSIVGINILQDWKYLVIVFVASQLPDIDHTKSLIGKFFYPIAKLINRRYGHRTITHSLIFLILTTAILSAFQAAYFPTEPMTQIYFLAVSSHLIFDMMTIQGVPLLYPFLKNACVLPGNPNMRLRTSDIRSETAVFSFFIVSAVFLQPLMENGFWTSYNRLFGTVKHLQSEFNKSEDLLLVTFNIQEGSEILSKEGYCIATDGSSLTILEDEQFRSYPGEKQKVFDVNPIHTTKRFHFERKRFINISLDSLHTILSESRITKIDIIANEEFIHIQNGIERKSKALKLKYLNDLILKEIPRAIETFNINPVISKVKEKKMQLILEEQLIMEQYQESLSEYNRITDLINSTKEYIQKELLLEKYANYKRPNEPISNQNKINELEIRIKELEYEDKLKYAEHAKATQANQLQFSGDMEAVFIG